MCKIFLVKYPGSWMGGNAVVKAPDEVTAYKMLKAEEGMLDDFEKCTFRDVTCNSGVLYNWDGEY